MLKRFKVKNWKPLAILLFITVAGAVIIGSLVYYQSRKLVVESDPVTKESPEKVIKEPTKPILQVEELATGLSNPWEVDFLPDGSLIVSERRGVLSLVNDEGEIRELASIRDVYAVGEGGLTGLALDKDFTNNRFIYTCFNSSNTGGVDVRLVQWKLSEDLALTDRKDLITGIPSNSSGRHSGCRIKTSTDGTIWVGTGDAATASHPQDPQSLGGKILRVSRDGMPVAGNLPEPFDPRIFSYGHRNVQGLVIFDKPKDDVFGFSIEHGSDIDDEVNLLKSGNFGWSPKVTYVESGIPMTDLERFPDAISAIWSSGASTIAPSGATKLRGDEWGTWDGAIAVAVLKNKHVRIMSFDSSYNLALEEEILNEYGRVRSTNIDSKGVMYITTDNGMSDKIIKIKASQRD